MMKQILTLSFVFLFPFVAMSQQKARVQKADQMVVSTESGLVKGFNQEGTTAFLGIPYAKVERFMPPLPVDKWDTVRICDHWGPQAMQNTRGRKLSEAEMSENSCVLNVWTTNLIPPKSKTQKVSLKPVMLWLHGGGFDSGTSAWNPGMQLAKKDVVVVSVNHRLNILGFLDLSACSEKYKYSGNVGMLDVVQALQWIQKNIRQFGGDPTNVTIFGESGGGGKVGSLLCMPSAKGLFQKAIIMSGTILNVNTKQMTEELGKAVLKELNIDANHIDDIRKVPYEELYAAGQRAMAASIGTRKPGTPMMWGFGPTPDGETMLQQPFQDGFADISNNVPILIGTTFNELQRLRYDQPMTQEEARRELFQTFGFDTGNYMKAFDEAYPGHTPQDLLSIDWLFRPKTIITADAIAETRQAPTYMYMFTWRSPVNKGSVHGHELKFCFNTLHLAGNELPQPTEADQRLADTMSSVWAQFAKTGNPNISGLPDWQPYTKENGELMDFNYECIVRHNHDRQLAQMIDKHCFQQLDDFRDLQNSKQLKVGDVTMTIFPQKGGKIMSLKYKGKEVISQQKMPESFGSTFWTSPQKEWNWPPIPEFDKQPYQVEECDGRLVMTSQVSEKLKYRIRKEISTDPRNQAFVVTYSIINESDETRQVAPWEITRVPNEGLIFFDAPLDDITPAGLMSFRAEHGAVWYQTDETNENRKINADGKGWLAYCNNGLLLVKQFEDLNASQPAPGEAEVQVYVNRGKTYIELESQGAYTTLKPKEQVSWTVRWYLQPVKQDESPAQLMQMVRNLTEKKLDNPVADLLKADPRKAYGTDYPYEFTSDKLTKAPSGYKPFYISHYGRHGSRYYWNAFLYRELDSMLTTAHRKQQLTAEGEAFYQRFEAAKDELATGVSELSNLGWEQHQRIARVMYNNFPEVFKKGGNVLAISSLSGRCVLSMSAFCQELVQCNPKIEIREQSSRFTLDGVVPGDRQNPVKHDFPKPKARFEKNRDQFKSNDTLREKVISRTFTSTQGLPGNLHHIGSNLINLYTSLPNIGHEGMMGNLITDEEIASEWESANLGTYAWLFPDQYVMIPILQDILKKADAVIDGSSDHIADLRFGHDNCLGPLHILMGINGADLDPENPYEVMNCYQNWETCKACNMQLIFYRSKKAGDDILVKCLLNGKEARLPVPTDSYPYYRWTDFRQFYTDRCNSVSSSSGK